MAIRPIDNLRAMLDGKPGSWLPFSVDIGAIKGFTDPVQRQFEQSTGAADPAEFFQTDTRLFSLKARFGGDDPASLHSKISDLMTFDEWGIGHVHSSVEGAVDKSYPPLANASRADDVESLPSPIVEDQIDTTVIDRFHASGYPVFGYAGSIYEWSWWLCGMEKFVMDMLDNPAFAEAVIRKVEAHTTRLAIASARAGIDVLCFYDDVGTQRGMQISPKLWRQFIRPAWQRVLEAVRSAAPRAKCFLHSCGRIDDVVFDIVELGFDILHPVQPECMDFSAVRRQYGANILLAATISVQKVFPFGSPDDVRREVRRLAEVVGPSKRAILMPSNVLQPETPWANILAFADEAQSLRNAIG